MGKKKDDDGKKDTSPFKDGGQTKECPGCGVQISLNATKCMSCRQIGR